MARKTSQLLVADDGLYTPEVGAWAEDKYTLLEIYCRMFSTGMKRRKRVYIDLYAGAGQSRIEGTSRYLKGSPLIALTVRDPFDKYVFCEEDPQRLDALKRRVNKIAPNADVSFVAGKCDEMVDEILQLIPGSGRLELTLSLCIVDPFHFGFKFETLKRLAAFGPMDFVVLLAIWMDTNRNYDHYVGTSTKLDEALGNKDWRDRWKESGGVSLAEFRRFVLEEFCRSMRDIGYLDTPLDQMKLISGDRNLRLYYLALFSRHPKAFEFWKDVLNYSNPQRTLL